MSKIVPINKGSAKPVGRLRGVVAPKMQDRAPRVSVFLAVVIVEKKTGKSFDALVRNLSATGALIQVESDEIPVGEISMSFRGVENMTANVVRHDGRKFGVMFSGVIDPLVCYKSIFTDTSDVPDWFRSLMVYNKNNRRPGIG